MDSIFIQDRTQSLDLEHTQIQPLPCLLILREVNFTIPEYDLHGVADEQKYARPHTRHMCPSKLSLYAIILVSDIIIIIFFFFFFFLGGGGGVISLNVIDLFTSPQFLSRTRHQLAGPPPPPPPPFFFSFFSFLISIPMSLEKERKNVGKSE